MKRKRGREGNADAPVMRRSRTWNQTEETSPVVWRRLTIHDPTDPSYRLSWASTVSSSQLCNRAKNRTLTSKQNIIIQEIGK